MPIGRARISAEATHSRLDSEFASQFGDSESYSRRTTARAQADATLARGLETSAGVELLGERAGGTFITATGNVLVPVKRGVAGFFGEARWNHGARLFVAAGIRVDRITREPLAGDADAFSPRPTFASDTVVSANPKVSAAWFLGATDGNYTKVRGSAGTGIRPPDAFEIAFTDNPSLEPERSKSFDAGVEQALFGGRGLVEATVFFNNYDDLIVATGSFSGSSQYRTDNISNARARGLELAGTARAPLSGLRGGSLQIRVGYTRLATEILAVDRERHRRRRRSSSATACCAGPITSSRPTCCVAAGPLSAFLQGGGRSSVRDVDPELRHLRRHLRRARIQRLERRRVVDVLEPAAALRPRHQPLRSRLRGSARVSGARPECDGGAEGCCEPLTSPSRYHAHGTPVAPRRLARRAGRRLRRHPRAERLGENDAAAPAGRHAPALERPGVARRRGSGARVARPRWRGGWPSCRRTRTSRSTSPRSKSS